ncbi:hypothetical protein [Jiangella muralis]|uniref:hypothetical protein n=1 Tax=Jiangella muralis TaxID=702383 RepID=UPI00069E9760|nr:hypothetical protein [Jiangella muralis]
MRQGDDGPLDLGVVGATPDEPDDEPRRGHSGRQVWAAVAAAFVIGGGLGLFVADAREEAAAYTEVRLVSGALQAIPDRADEASPGRIELSLLNLGEHAVEILGLELPGMTVRPDEEPAGPVAAPPGEWVSVSQGGLIADCAGTDPGGAPVRVRVRDAGGTERLAEMGALPDFGGALEVWGYVCRGPELVVPSTGSGATSAPGWYPLTGAAQAELVLMVDRVCGSTS